MIRNFAGGLASLILVIGAQDVIARDLIGEPKSLVNSIGMQLVLVPAGEFMMGSGESKEQIAKAFPIYKGPLADVVADEFPRHRVRITRPFYLGQHEVT